MASVLVRTFLDLTEEEQEIAGGKGRTLSKLARMGYRVPEGLIVLPSAFVNDEISVEACQQLESKLARLCKSHLGASFAVRSSAVAEDSALASFAGEFETILDVQSYEAIRKAINTVRGSRHNERVKAYSQTKSISTSHEMAVIVQRLVPAVVSGVLFTADPVTGDRNKMVGNYVHGLGDKLVSGEAKPTEFTIERLGHRYKGSFELERFAQQLYGLGTGIERRLRGPQDIEWAIADNKLYLLQSRPITTLIGHNAATGEWNDSLIGDYLWSRNNYGEARPDVMTPLTWSLTDVVYKETNFLPGYSMAGNICGRFYANVSVMVSMLRAMGKSTEVAFSQLEGFFGHMPEAVDVPIITFPKSIFLLALPKMIKMAINEKRGATKISKFLAMNPNWCRGMQHRFQEVQTKAELVSLWHAELEPRLFECMWIVAASAQPLEASRKLHRELTSLVGEADANALLSNFSDNSAQLESLGPLIGTVKVARGEMSRKEYLEQYGHRDPHEAELSAPRPAGNPDLLERQLEELRKSPVDIDALLAKRRASFHAAWQRFVERYPQKANNVRRRIDQVGPAGRLREDVRSEVTRFYGLIRSWAVRAGELTTLGNDIFFLYIDELLALLSDNATAIIKYISARKETYARYGTLPAYPVIIRGRFDPFKWANDKNRRYDIYDTTSIAPTNASDTISGFAGAAGCVEGRVRVLDRPEQGDQLQTGEILVAVTTNIGWTPLFPRVAALVTDVGAPLSHAAIVARELGIPAVVGCGSATSRLRTGDRVRVNGGRGTVEILGN